MKRSNVEMKLILVTTILYLLLFVNSEYVNTKKQIKKQIIKNTFDNNIDRKNVIEEALLFLNSSFLSIISFLNVNLLNISEYIKLNSPIVIEFILNWKFLFLFLISFIICSIAVYMILKSPKHDKNIEDKEDKNNEAIEKIPLLGRKLKKPKFQVDYSNIFKTLNNNEEIKNKSKNNLNDIISKHNEYNDPFNICNSNEYEKELFEDKKLNYLYLDDKENNLVNNKNEFVDFTNPKVQSYVFSKTKYELENSAKLKNDKDEIFQLFEDIPKPFKYNDEKIFVSKESIKIEDKKILNLEKISNCNDNDDFFDFFSEANKFSETKEFANPKEELNIKLNTNETNAELLKKNLNKSCSKKNDILNNLGTIKETNEDHNDESFNNLTNTSTTLSVIEDYANEDERILQKIKKMNLKRCMIKPNN